MVDAARSDQRRPARDRGAATVWVLAAGLVLVVVALAFAAAGAAIVARHRAQSAADLAALAGAASVVRGDPCERARDIAAANDARLVSCAVDGWDVVVTAEVTPAGVAAFAGAAVASARAGPVDHPRFVIDIVNSLGLR